MGVYLLAMIVSFLSGFLGCCGDDSTQMHVVMVLLVSVPSVRSFAMGLLGWFGII